MTDAPAAGGGRTALQATVLEDLTEARNYRAWLCRLALPWLGDRPLEVGSGLGDYAAEWARAVGRITASEADPYRLRRLERRFADDQRVAVRRLVAPITDTGSYSAVVAYNVLEHIPDDVAALASFTQLVAPGGHVIVLVPAFRFAMSRFDRAIGHERRYTRTSLAAAFTAAGLSLVHLRYVNAVGLLAWVVGMRVLGLRPPAGRALGAFDRLVPLLERLEALRAPPFGQSVLAVGVRDA